MKDRDSIISKNELILYVRKCKKHCVTLRHSILNWKQFGIAWCYWLSNSSQCGMKRITFRPQNFKLLTSRDWGLPRGSETGELDARDFPGTGKCPQVPTESSVFSVTNLLPHLRSLEGSRLPSYSGRTRR